MSPLEQAFIAHKQLGGLCNNNTSNVNPIMPLSLQTIVNEVLAPQNSLILSRINTSIRYLNCYKMVLNAVSNKQSRPQVAASSVSDSLQGLLIERCADGFTLKLIQDTDNSNEIHLIVKLDEVTTSQANKGLFIHCEFEKQFYLLHLTNFSGSNFQSLLSKSMASTMAILHPDSHIYLT